MSQIGILSVTQSDIHHIGTNRMNCGEKMEIKSLLNIPSTQSMKRMAKYGTERLKENPKYDAYLKMMSLDEQHWNESSELLPAYRSLTIISLNWAVLNSGFFLNLCVCTCYHIQTGTCT